VGTGYSERRGLLDLARVRANSAPFAIASASERTFAFALLADGFVGRVPAGRVAFARAAAGLPAGGRGLNSEPSPGRGWPRNSGGVIASRQSRK
jgi:hypothetical protein